jgi:hypothetical protein
MAIGFVVVLVSALGANTTNEDSSELVVGIKQWPLFKDDTLVKQKTNLPGGTRITVIRAPKNRMEIEVKTTSGDMGFIQRFAICTQVEFNRRKVQGEIPNSIAKILYTNGNFAIAPIGDYVDISIGNDTPRTQPGQAYWIDDSIQGKPFYISSQEVYSNHLYLVKADNSVVELPIWDGTTPVNHMAYWIFMFILWMPIIIVAIISIMRHKLRQPSVSQAHTIPKLESLENKAEVSKGVVITSDKRDRKADMGDLAAVYLTHKAKTKSNRSTLLWWFVGFTTIALFFVTAVVVMWNLREHDSQPIPAMASKDMESTFSIAPSTTNTNDRPKNTISGEKSTKESEPRAKNVLNVLRVKYGGMLHSGEQIFSSSVAFWQSESSLVIVFRNFGTTMDDASAKPSLGRARLVAIIRTDGLEITSGTYHLGLLESRNTSHVFVRAMEDKEKQMYLFAVSAAWEVSRNGKIEVEFWKDYRTMLPDQFRNMLKNLGTITLTELGHQPGSNVAGTISLGSEDHLNMAVGAFRVPVLAPPQDY